MDTRLKELTLGTADHLDDVTAALNALALMTDGYLLGAAEYDPAETANAMHLVINAALEQIAAAKADLRASMTA